MPAAADYLEITPSAARTQWRSIVVRSKTAEGRRQVAFAPAETLLCLAASLMVNHRRYGGSTAHRAEEPVPSLARLFRRPNSSVLAKMANLDGSRRNGARHEVEVAARLLGNQDDLAASYRIIVRAARDVGVTVTELPDFLHLEHDDAPLVLLGQDELSTSDIEDVVQAEHPGVSDHATELLLIAAARVGQHRFAREVLHNHAHRCVFCGLSISVENRRAPRMLVASHIKPWRVSDSRERVDVANGLAACPTHDVAFDTGLLSINGGLRIHVHASVHATADLNPAVRAAFGRPPLAEHLLLPLGAQPPQGVYLDWHRTHVYRGTSTT
ncbi:HNH endonuclease [Plantactinospora sp. S1510]|uniref:HNH endonuclease n=1 Tax=Plantactinospora alkalitolerans TaxID=2789879 RepID=A0ABS0GYW0_9ACTN|nr:HNH endonuclease [Plantactinospora alkalitolerans]MBF9131395.1 HNH endonuclease [Plantactinospora alkalitolerans]